MFRKQLWTTIAMAALFICSGSQPVQAGSGKDVGFEFKVQVSPKDRSASEKWTTVVSYPKKSEADAKAQKLRNKYSWLEVRVKQKK